MAPVPSSIISLSNSRTLFFTKVKLTFESQVKSPIRRILPPNENSRPWFCALPKLVVIEKSGIPVEYDWLEFRIRFFDFDLK